MIIISMLLDMGFTPEQATKYLSTKYGKSIKLCIRHTRCGPEDMFEYVLERADQHGLNAEVSFKDYNRYDNWETISIQYTVIGSFDNISRYLLNMGYCDLENVDKFIEYNLL